jgi:phenylacetic acid degradation protein
VAGTRLSVARRSLATIVECDPLSQIEPERKRIHMPDVIPLVELKKR